MSACTENKIIITTYKDNLITAFNYGGRFYDIDISAADIGTADNSYVGNIYIGVVKDIVKNINSAFIEFSKENNEIHRGYMSLDDNKSWLKLSNTANKKLCQGDYVLVQVEKDSQKSKYAVLTSNINLPGRYLILTRGKNILGFSSKIPQNEDGRRFKDELRTGLAEFLTGEYGFIVRTKSYGADIEAILQEARELANLCREIVNTAKTRTCYSLIHRPVPGYIRLITERYNAGFEIVTDIPDIYDGISSYFSGNHIFDTINLRLYDDKLITLSKLYSLEYVLSEACNKKVWLKSGGYLYIEPTEAMTVIDVNTGKYDKGRNSEDTFLKTNIEAAREICRQLRLRNISGIIVIDFIDMKIPESRQKLLSVLVQCLSEDPIKAVFVEFTKLGLATLTRKKVKPSIYECLKGQNNEMCKDKEYNN